MDKIYEIYREGLMRTIKFKRHNVGTSYETIEFTIRNKLSNEDGKVVIDSGHTAFFSPKEFKEFFGPIFSEMKERIEHDLTDSIQNG